MSMRDSRGDFRSLIERHAEVGAADLRRVFAEVMREFETERGWSESNHGNSWTDEALVVVLSDAPTKENSLKHAKAFSRGYGAIEKIYRWAATTDADIERKRPDDAFVQQVKKVAKSLGWRA